MYIRYIKHEILLEYAMHCGASLSERNEVCCRFSSTVEDGALSLSFQRKRPFAQHEDSVIGEAIEVYTNCDL